MTSIVATKINEFKAHDSQLRTLALGHASGRVLATSADDNKVNLWAIGQSQCIITLNQNGSLVNALRFGHADELILTGCLKGFVNVWDLHPIQTIRTFNDCKSSVTSLDMSLSGLILANGASNGNINVYDMRSATCITELKHYDKRINCIRFSPDNKWLATASDGTSIKIWDLSTRKTICELNGHTLPINKIEFHPTDLILASSSLDKTIKFWDLEKFDLINTTPPEKTVYNSIFFDTNGHSLLASHRNGLRILNSEPLDHIDEIKVDWGTIIDMALAQQQLIASSFSGKMVSTYGIDLKKCKTTYPKSMNKTRNLNGLVNMELPPISSTDGLVKKYSTLKTNIRPKIPTGIINPGCGNDPSSTAITNALPRDINAESGLDKKRQLLKYRRSMSHLQTLAQGNECYAKKQQIANVVNPNSLQISAINSNIGRLTNSKAGVVTTPEEDYKDYDISEKVKRLADIVKKGATTSITRQFNNSTFNLSQLSSHNAPLKSFKDRPRSNYLNSSTLNLSHVSHDKPFKSFFNPNILIKKDLSMDNISSINTGGSSLISKPIKPLKDQNNLIKKDISIVNTTTSINTNSFKLPLKSSVHYVAKPIKTTTMSYLDKRRYHSFKDVHCKRNEMGYKENVKVNKNKLEQDSSSPSSPINLTEDLLSSLADSKDLQAMETIFKPRSKAVPRTPPIPSSPSHSIRNVCQSNVSSLPINNSNIFRNSSSGYNLTTTSLTTTRPMVMIRPSTSKAVFSDKSNVNFPFNNILQLDKYDAGNASICSTNLFYESPLTNEKTLVNNFIQNVNLGLGNSSHLNANDSRERQENEYPFPIGIKKDVANKITYRQSGSHLYLGPGQESSPEETSEECFVDMKLLTSNSSILNDNYFNNSKENMLNLLSSKEISQTKSLLKTTERSNPISVFENFKNAKHFFGGENYMTTAKGGSDNLSAIINNEFECNNNYPIQNISSINNILTGGNTNDNLTTHLEMCETLSSRLRHVKMAKNFFRNNGNILSALDLIFDTNEESIFVDVLSLLLKCPNLWTLDISLHLLPRLNDLLNHKYETYMTLSCKALKLILKNFGSLIKSSQNRSTVIIGVDLSREERFKKCHSCYKHLSSIKNHFDNSILFGGKLGKEIKDLQILLQTLD
ncbi:unnamed protein product [Gordionus sp. m RMFG-2023]|uniref:uncharacterized protein LOC135925423 n=1 Tax=Gordionus sp. m RMFG-2023 TaxID=3053472 RepID=UPI0030E5AA0B